MFVFVATACLLWLRGQRGARARGNAGTPGPGCRAAWSRWWGTERGAKGGLLAARQTTDEIVERDHTVDRFCVDLRGRRRRLCVLQRERWPCVFS
jgi:hypothetical protein